MSQKIAKRNDLLVGTVVHDSRYKLLVMTFAHRKLYDKIKK